MVFSDTASDAYVLFGTHLGAILKNSLIIQSSRHAVIERGDVSSKRLRDVSCAAGSNGVNPVLSSQGVQPECPTRIEVSDNGVG